MALHHKLSPPPASPGRSNGMLLVFLAVGLTLVVLDHYVLGAEVIASAIVAWHSPKRK